jgi:hypothetical protein
LGETQYCSRYCSLGTVTCDRGLSRQLGDLAKRL